MSKLNVFQKFILWSAGANPKILAREEWISERYKHSAIGMTILLTGLMEFLSGGYALFTIFGSPAAFALGGIVWGSTVFNLNRFFVLSSRKKKDQSKSAYVAASVVRIVLASLLSFIVAKPLELRLFKPEIDREIPNVLLDERKKSENRLANSRTLVEIESKEEEIRALKDVTANAFSKWQASNTLAIEEITGESGTGRAGRGLVSEEKREQADILYQSYQEIRENNEQEVARLQDELAQLRLDQDANRDQALGQQPDGNPDGLLYRLIALENLREDRQVISRTGWLITIIFIAIEISPILVTILSAKGPYEDFMEQEEKYEMPRQYIQELDSKKLEAVGTALRNSLQNIKDFEIAVEEIKGSYLKEKDRSRERLLNISNQEVIETIEENFHKELERFLQLCDEDRTLYENIALSLIKKSAHLSSKSNIITSLEELNSIDSPDNTVDKM